MHDRGLGVSHAARQGPHRDGRADAGAQGELSHGLGEAAPLQGRLDAQEEEEGAVRVRRRRQVDRVSGPRDGRLAVDARDLWAQAGVVVAVLRIELGDLLGIPFAQQDAERGGSGGAALVCSRERGNEYRVFQLRQDNAFLNWFGHRSVLKTVMRQASLDVTLSIDLIVTLSRRSETRPCLADIA